MKNKKTSSKKENNNDSFVNIIDFLEVDKNNSMHIPSKNIKSEDENKSQSFNLPKNEENTRIKNVRKLSNFIKNRKNIKKLEVEKKINQKKIEKPKFRDKGSKPSLHKVNSFVVSKKYKEKFINDVKNKVNRVNLVKDKNINKYFIKSNKSLSKNYKDFASNFKEIFPKLVIIQRKFFDINSKNELNLGSLSIKFNKLFFKLSKKFDSSFKFNFFSWNIGVNYKSYLNKKDVKLGKNFVIKENFYEHCKGEYNQESVKFFIFLHKYNIIPKIDDIKINLERYLESNYNSFLNKIYENDGKSSKEISINDFLLKTNNLEKNFNKEKTITNILAWSEEYNKHIGLSAKEIEQFKSLDDIYNLCKSLLSAHYFVSCQLFNESRPRFLDKQKKSSASSESNVNSYSEEITDKTKYKSKSLRSKF